MPLHPHPGLRDAGALELPATVYVLTAYPDSGIPMGWSGCDRWVGTSHEHELSCRDTCWPSRFLADQRRLYPLQWPRVIVARATRRAAWRSGHGGELNRAQMA